MLVTVQPQPAVISPCPKASGTMDTMARLQIIEAHMSFLLPTRLLLPVRLIILGDFLPLFAGQIAGSRFAHVVSFELRGAG